jgi:hypothetical protein
MLPSWLFGDAVWYTQVSTLMQIAKGYQTYCTLGYNDTNGGVAGFWTAGHCSPSSLGDGHTGGVMYQHEGSAIYRVGTVMVNPAWDDTTGACHGASMCTNADGMFVAYDSDTLSSNRVAKMTGWANCCALAYGTRNGSFTNVSLSTYSVLSGDGVDKIGRTTGWSHGNLGLTCQTKDITASDGVTVYREVCLDQVTGAYAGAGDSGGPVFIQHDTTSATQLKALGILVATDFGGGFGYEDGEKFCNNSSCSYWFVRLSRLRLYLTAPE